MHVASRVRWRPAPTSALLGPDATMLTGEASRRRRVRGPHRGGQEPDDASRRRDAARRPGAASSWSAIPCRTATSSAQRRPAVRARCDDLDAADVHDRGARGIRAAHRRGHRRLRRRRLRRRSCAQAQAGVRRAALGRRQQRPAVLPPEPARSSCVDPLARATSSRTTRARPTSAWPTSCVVNKVDSAPPELVDAAGARRSARSTPAP